MRDQKRGVIWGQLPHVPTVAHGCAGHLLPVRTMGKPSRTSPASSTTPSSGRSSAWPSARRTPGRCAGTPTPVGPASRGGGGGAFNSGAEPPHPTPRTQVILTGDVSGGSRGGRIFRSSDFAKNFVQTDLPFHPLVQVTYHPHKGHWLLALSTEVRVGSRAGCDPGRQMLLRGFSWAQGWGFVFTIFISDRDEGIELPQADAGVDLLEG